MNNNLAREDNWKMSNKNINKNRKERFFENLLVYRTMLAHLVTIQKFYLSLRKLTQKFPSLEKIDRRKRARNSLKFFFKCTYKG